MTRALLACALAAATPAVSGAAPAASPAPAVAAAVDDDDAGVEAWLFAGEGYRLRTTGAESDHLGRLLVDGGASAFDGKLGADLSGALFWDIDGKSPGFPSVHDAHLPVDLVVDTLELKASPTPWLVRASAGRFTVDEGWPMTLDGAALTLAPVRAGDLAWLVFASAGRTVHFYDLDGGFEDWAASLGTDLALAEGVKLELDDRVLAEDAGGHRVQNSWGAAFWRRVDDSMLLKVYFRGLDGDVAHVGTRAHLAYTPWRIGLDVDAAEQPIALGEVFEGENPFFAVLGESKPHVRGSVDAWARHDFGLFDGGLHAGAAGNQVLFHEESAFNRDFGRVYASLDAADVVVKGPFLSAILSYDFAVSAGQSAVLAAGGTAGYAGDALRFSVGTSWDRVKYDYYRDVNELVDVRTVFADLEVRPLPELRVKGGYTLEVSDRVVHTVELTLTQDLGGAW